MESIAPEARLRELLAAYLAAEYRWQPRGEWLSLHVGRLAPAIEAAYPLASRFGLLSAWNPWSVERADAENRIADEALQSALVGSGAPFRPAFASAPNRSWREPSWGVVGLGLGEFDALTRRFGQLGALWWWRGEPVRLRMHAARPPRLDDALPVDWLQ